MNPHDYNKSSDSEKAWHPVADSFYYSKYPNCGIKRYTNDSTIDLAFQKKDIDLSILQNEKIIHLSEKFRQVDYGDLLIELYSKFPNTKGWMENNGSDFLVYFSPKKVYIIKKLELLNWYQNENFEVLLKDEIESFHQNHFEKSARKKMKINTKSENDISATLIQAYNITNGTSWHTISIAIQWSDLIKDGVSVKIFSLED